MAQKDDSSGMNVSTYDTAVSDSEIRTLSSTLSTTTLEEGSEFHWSKPMELFSEKKVVKMCAPMVRYSKLSFRMLVRKYNCDIAFTPMIISNSFVQSQKARDSDFTTCKGDRPLIVQFAASNSKDFADAAEIVAPYADGVDLNCGCPQRWAMSVGYGACLINKSELICDMVKAARSRVPQEDFTVSVKMRIHKNIRDTVDVCQKVEKAGASFLSVHGRTKEERCQPVHYDAIKLIKDSINIPVVANGDIKSMSDVTQVSDMTGANGVMSARGILANPAMYAGYTETPQQCVKDWVDFGLTLGTPFTCFHHHLMYMLERNLCRSERRYFNSLTSMSSVLDFLKTNYRI